MQDGSAQPQLVNKHNREPIKAIALYMGCRVETAIRRCKQRRLEFQRDGSGYYWSSTAAAEAFFAGSAGCHPNAIPRMRRSLDPRSKPTTGMGRLSCCPDGRT